MKTILVTGSSGLIGSEACLHFARNGCAIHGIDNNQREVFFGPLGDTRLNQQRLVREIAGFVHYELDIRDRQGVVQLVERLCPSAIVHCAAQPSHDRSAAIPFDDFDINAGGTINLLEAARRFSPDAPFIYVSTTRFMEIVLTRSCWRNRSRCRDYNIGSRGFSHRSTPHSLSSCPNWLTSSSRSTAVDRHAHVACAVMSYRSQPRGRRAAWFFKLFDPV